MKKIFVSNILLLLLAIFVDQITKYLAGDFFLIVKNQGLLLNSFEDLPTKIKVIALASTAGVIFFFYLTFIYLLGPKLTPPRFALSLVMGGILSNTLDKIIFGYTIDFIPLGSWAFNVADLFTTGASLYLIFYILKNHESIWTADDNRRSLFVNPRAQVMFGLKYSIVALCTSFLLGLLAYTFIKTYIFPVVLTSSQNILPMFLVLHLSMTILFSSVVFVIGIVVSHRFVGPIIALERFVDNLSQGKDVDLSLRQGDYFKQLEELSRKISEIKKGSNVK